MMDFDLANTECQGRVLSYQHVLTVSPSTVGPCDAAPGPSRPCPLRLRGTPGTRGGSLEPPSPRAMTSLPTPQWMPRSDGVR